MDDQPRSDDQVNKRSWYNHPFVRSPIFMSFFYLVLVAAAILMISVMVHFL